jgi:molybdate transport system permease protein
VSARRGLPAALALPAVVAVLFFALPLLGLVLRAPWSDFVAEVRSPEVADALWLSLQCSVAAALVSLVLGLPLAAWLAGEPTRLRAIVRVLVTLPMVLPPVVGGVALLFAYGRRGLVGGPLEELVGFALPFTVAGVIAAETWVAMPFRVLTVEGGLRSLDARFADAAATLGASPWRTYRSVTLPMIGPSLRAGLLVAWARALGEFGATITFAGSLPGVTRTLPIASYLALQSEPGQAIALAIILLVVSVVVLLGLRDRWMPGVGR